MCPDCLFVGAHKGHPAMLFSDSRSHVQDKADTLRGEEDTVVKAKVMRAIADAKLKRVDDSFTAVELGVKAKFDELVAMLEAKRKATFDRLDDEYTRSAGWLRQVKSTIASFESRAKATKGLAGKVEKAKITPDDYDRVGVYRPHDLEDVKGLVRDHERDLVSAQEEILAPIFSFDGMQDAIDAFVYFGTAEELRAKVLLEEQKLSREIIDQILQSVSVVSLREIPLPRPASSSASPATISPSGKKKKATASEEKQCTARAPVKDSIPAGNCTCAKDRDARLECGHWVCMICAGRMHRRVVMRLAERSEARCLKCAATFAICKVICEI